MHVAPLDCRRERFRKPVVLRIYRGWAPTVLLWSYSLRVRVCLSTFVCVFRLHYFGDRVTYYGEFNVWREDEEEDKQQLDDLEETKRYWKLKAEALDRTLWRTRFGRGCGPAVRQTAWWWWWWRWRRRRRWLRVNSVIDLYFLLRFRERVKALTVITNKR